MRPALIRITYDLEYIEELKERGVRAKRKAVAYMLYAYNVKLKQRYSIRYYAEIWDIGKTTACNWIKEFDGVINGEIR